MKMGAIGYLRKPIASDELDHAFKKIEKSLTKTLRELLIVQGDESIKHYMDKLFGGKDVSIATAATWHEAYHRIKSSEFDCVVLVLKTTDLLEDDLLESIENDTKNVYLPIIVYSGKPFTQEEMTRLMNYEERLVLKRVTTREQLIDEVTLFLHRVETAFSEAGQKMLRMIHNKKVGFDDKNILVVDADMRNVFALSNILEQQRMNVLIGENGKEALKLLASHPEVNLILLDMMLPDMDGYEAMKRIRSQDAFRNLPIIALSAKAVRGERQKCIKVGANEYLSKPIDANKLLSVLRVWLY
jgi:CheY-like chemotaxis protein